MAHVVVILPPELRIETLSGTLRLQLSGDWIKGATIPAIEPLLERLADDTPPRVIRFDCHDLNRWDSLLLTFLVKLVAAGESHAIPLEVEGLPEGVRGMLHLARSVPERQDTGRLPAADGFVAQVGRYTLNGIRDFWVITDFVGEISLGFLRLLSGRGRFRLADLYKLLQHCGPSALPIISLIATLVGMILAFVGAVQLKLFGAQIFIADLVGLGMAREMGAMMTAILMAGRTGAAFAAELGSMVVNDEVDALKTSGFSPIDFLVIPRIIALTLSIPFLCFYADVLGIFGGSLVAAGLFDISFDEYLAQLRFRLRPIDFEVGIAKSAVFGLLVAVAGCLRGLQCQRSATAVGLATTSAVVTGIVFIVASDAVMTLIITTLNLLKR